MAKLENKLVQTFYNTFQALHSVHNYFIYSLNDGKITPEGQKMLRSEVKIIKSPIIQQLCQFEPKKLAKLEN